MINSTNASGHSISENRKSELLEMARISRMRWILEDVAISGSPTIQKASPNLNNSLSTTNSSTKIMTPITGAGCLQDILNFLMDVCKVQESNDDNDYLDILTLIPTEEEIFDSKLIENMTQSEDEDYVDVSEDQINSYYNHFLDKLRRSEAIDVVRSMRRFVNDMKNTLIEMRSNIRSKFQLADEDQNHCIDLIWKFLERILSQIREIPSFANNKFVNSKLFEICLEKFLFTKLHGILFSTDLEDSKLDHKMKERMKDLQFITTEHLEVRNVTNLVLEVPVNYLRDLNKYKCPGDKYLCIKYCSKSINAILKADNQTNEMPGADDFLPMMILVLKEANPDQLHSNIKYLQNYTHPMKLIGEPGYILTQFISAAVFLENADAAALTISPLEFERAILRCKDISNQQMQKLEAERLKNINHNDIDNLQSNLSNDSNSHNFVDQDDFLELAPKLSVMDVRRNRLRGLKF